MPTPSAPRVIDQLPAAAQTWVRESGEAEFVLCMVTPQKQRFFRVPREAPPKYRLSRVFRDNKGHLFERTLEWDCMLRSRESLPKELGIDLDHQTMMRLFNGGFIKGCRPTPNAYLFDLASIHAHIAASSVPGFWTEERKQRYTAAVRRRPLEIGRVHDDDEEEDS